MKRLEVCRIGPLISSAGGPGMLIDDPGATTYPGKCTCNEPFIDELADTFVDALPKIAEVQAQ